MLEFCGALLTFIVTKHYKEKERMTVTNTVTETEHLTPLRSAVEHINWNTLYQQKMALEEVSDMLYAKRKEDDTFGKASAWLESVIALMERLGDAAEEEGKFDYPERDENDEHLDNRFNHVLNQYPDVDI